MTNNKNKKESYYLDPLIVLNLIKKNWYFFIGATLIGFWGARFYIGHTLPKYEVSTSILINETGERSVMDSDEFLRGMGLPGGMRNLENQIQER